MIADIDIEYESRILYVLVWCYLQYFSGPNHLVCGILCICQQLYIWPVLSTITVLHLMFACCIRMSGTKTRLLQVTETAM